MQLTKVTARFGATITTCGYNNIRPEFTLEAELDDNDRENIDETLSELMFMARYAVAESLIQSITSAFNNNIHWYANVHDLEDMRSSLKINIEMFRWVDENAEMMADDFVESAWNGLQDYKQQNPTPEPVDTTPSTPNLDEIPF